MDSPGDLVCTKPFPVMPVGFWNDADGKKYQNAYFNQIRGVWYHGDYLEISSETGGVVMLGRSDGTLNPAGVRFGSAELYNIMTAFLDVEDSLAVGQQTSDGERVVLFLKMAPGKSFSPELVSSINLRIRTLLSARHVPSVIYPIGDIPYTITGKKVEVAVKKILSGEIVKPSSSLANPESLDLFVKARSKL
jgi:acetoacetyl-CoA synthetase